jgi:hypothetical protein
VPKSSGREELSALIGLEVLLEGIAFDTHDLRRLPISPALITKVLRSLQQSGVLQRVNTGKYLFTGSFSGAMKERVLGKTPRSELMQFPAMTVFDMCGIECWTERDLEHFTQRLRQYWSSLVVKGDAIKGRELT